jgi:uncharacterized protein YndB with AHSA1/START domain
MPEFSLATTWRIPASPETVWSCLIHTETWPSWWKYVIAVDEISAGEPNGLNNVRHYVWRTALPYRLAMDLRVTELKPRQSIAVEVSGDLRGKGLCRLACQTAPTETQVRFHWHVRTCKPWMDWFGDLSRPVFIWNHGKVMESGEQGLLRRLTETTKKLAEREAKSRQGG